jgi:hypothetical protein
MDMGKFSVAKKKKYCAAIRISMSCQRFKKLPPAQLPEETWFHVMVLAKKELAYASQRVGLEKASLAQHESALSTAFRKKTNAQVAHAQDSMDFKGESPDSTWTLRYQELQMDEKKAESMVRYSATNLDYYIQHEAFCKEEVRIVEECISRTYAERDVRLCQNTTECDTGSIIKSIAHCLVDSKDWNELQKLTMTSKECNVYGQSIRIRIPRPNCKNQIEMKITSASHCVFASFGIGKKFGRYTFVGLPDQDAISIAVLRQYNEHRLNHSFLFSHPGILTKKHEAKGFTPNFFHVAGRVMGFSYRNGICVHLAPKFLCTRLDRSALAAPAGVYGCTFDENDDGMITIGTKVCQAYVEVFTNRHPLVTFKKMSYVDLLNLKNTRELRRRFAVRLTPDMTTILVIPGPAYNYQLVF